MSDILDLDDLTSVLKKFKFKGKTYDVCEVTLGTFIEMRTELKDMELRNKEGAITEDDLIESYLKNIKRAVPSLTDDVMSGMTLNQLRVLMDFINSAAVDEKAVKEAQAEKK